MNASLRAPRVLVSADSHASDYPTFWNAELLKVYGSRAPHIARGGGSSAHGISPLGLFGDWTVGEGLVPFPTGGGNVGGFPRPERPRRLVDFDFEAHTPKGAIEPHARLATMDEDGLRAEVIYPTYALRIPTMRDPSLQRACLKASNAWMAEYCRPAPDRLIGSGVLSLVDASAAAEDLQEGVRLGLRGFAVLATPPPEMSYASMRYERFWAAAAEAGVPIMLHALPPPETAAASGRRRAMVAESAVMHAIEDYHLPNVLYEHPIQVSATQLILSGVLERHPKLRLVFGEWGTAWLPGFLANLDWTYTSRRDGLSLKMLPSEYLARQVSLTFDRPLGMAPTDLERFQDCLMFASDYPHIESCWPESQSSFDAYVGDVPPSIASKLAHQNAARLYGLSV